MYSSNVDLGGGGGENSNPGHKMANGRIEIDPRKKKSSRVGGPWPTVNHDE